MNTYTSVRKSSVLILVLAFVTLPGQLLSEDGSSARVEADFAARLSAGDGRPFDNFGFAVAVSGSIAVVGAPGHATEERRDGAAYVFERDPADGTWHQVAELSPPLKNKAFFFGPQADLGDNFGFAVAVAGDVVVVGAPNENVGAEADAGAAYVFERHEGGEGNWGQVARLSAASAAEDRRFGLAVAASGDTVVIGAPGDAAGLRFVGSAYVFERSSAGTWASVAELEPVEGMDGDCFGFSVALHGSSVVVGAPFSDPLGPYSGSAYVYERDDEGAWQQAATLVGSDTDVGDRFGQAVGLAGGTAVVGAPKHDVPGRTGRNAGGAYVFLRDASGVWQETSKLVASDAFLHDRFGDAVAISGTTVAVGASGNNVHGVTGGFGSGSVYLFAPDAEGTWTELAQLYDLDAGLFDVFGATVALDEASLLAGTPDNDDRGPSSGSVMVFERGAASDE